MKKTAKIKSTILEFLIDAYPDSPRTRIKKILKSGTLTVNERPVTLHSFIVNPGDIVEVNKQQGQFKASKNHLPFPILFSDKDFIVVDKPAGRPTSSIDGSLSVRDIVSEMLLDQSFGKQKAHVVHRLDKEVSGVLLFAKSEEAMEDLKDKWQETEKRYFAFVEGVPEKKEDTISGWLREDNRQLVHSTTEQEGAKFSVTHYKLIRTVGGNALLDIKTDTGRKNQIRVHMSEMGHPIIGDRRYGASDKFKRRIRLHAYHLSFPHPYTDKIITVKSQMPAGFLELKPQDEKYK